MIPFPNCCSVYFVMEWLSVYVCVLSMFVYVFIMYFKKGVQTFSPVQTYADGQC